MIFSIVDVVFVITRSAYLKEVLYVYIITSISSPLDYRM